MAANDKVPLTEFSKVRLMRRLPTAQLDGLKYRAQNVGGAGGAAPEPNSGLIAFLTRAFGLNSAREAFMFVSPRATSMTDRTFAVGPAAQYVASGFKRRYFFIANVGGNDIRMSIGQPASATTGLLMASNGFWEPLIPPMDTISVQSSGGSTVVIIEG